jgi:hypothetical protein
LRDQGLGVNLVSSGPIGGRTALRIMSRTIRNRRLDSAAGRRCATADRLKRAASQRRDAYRETRLAAAPEPLWVVYGDWDDGFAVCPLRPGSCAGPGGSLISDPGDVTHLDIRYWQI